MSTRSKIVKASLEQGSQHGPQHGSNTGRTAGRRGATPPRSTKAPGPPAGAALPHERDESVGSTAAAPDPVIVQAKRDLDAGLVDTDMRATPGLDAQRRAKLVPGPGGKPPAQRG